MVNGRLRCLGSTQHLKNKFGEGFTLIVKVAPGQHGNLNAVRADLEGLFPAAVLKDLHQGMLHYHIPDPSLKWADLFQTLEDCKERLNLDDYLLSQTTLDQVFINFARAQIPPQEVEIGCCARCRLCCPCRPCGGYAEVESDSESPIILSVDS